MKNVLNLKIMGLLAGFMLMITIVQAQEVKIGVRVGVNISNQQFKQGELTVEPKSKFGLDLAVVSDIPLGEVVSFAPELHWLQKGFVIEDFDNPPVTFDEGTATLNYLELPLLIKFNFGETAKFFVMGGPSIGYLLDHKLVIDGEDNDDLFEFDNRLELGAHLGAGIGIGPVVVDLRYLLGISNITDEPDAEIKNNGFGAGVSLMF